MCIRDRPEAERNYKLLFQSTNWAPCELTYTAQLMAGRAAVARQGWKDVDVYKRQAEIEQEDAAEFVAAPVDNIELVAQDFDAAHRWLVFIRPVTVTQEGEPST